jgi:A/G-specific adenine glycosylase
MLQQTQAARVVPAFLRFVRRFPTVRMLARAGRRDVILAWDGLGYNRRAVALSDAARAIEREHGGQVPRDPAALQRLPGVGPYTAAAVAAIAHGLPVVAVDTNVRRVVARFLAGVEADELGPAEARSLAAWWLDREDPGSWNQALMDLGREVCRRRPRCEVCPLRGRCRFVAVGRAPSPVRSRGGAFEGSFRQVRGAVVRQLRTRPSATVAELAADAGVDVERLRSAVEHLTADGLVVVRRGRVLLAD